MGNNDEEATGEISILFSGAFPRSLRLKSELVRKKTPGPEKWPACVTMQVVCGQTVDNYCCMRWNPNAIGGDCKTAKIAKLLKLKEMMAQRY